jgi:hypothetical protein
MKKSPLGIAACLIALSQSGLAAFAQPAGSSGGDGVTNYGTGGSSAGTATSTPTATTPAPPSNAGPQVPAAPSTSTDPNPDHFPWMETPPGAKPSRANANSGTQLKPEAAATAPVPTKADDVQERKSPAPAKTSAAPVQRAASSQQPMKLFGRIEQIAGHSGARFPELQAMTPKLDPRGVQQPKRLQASQSAFSGKIVRSFPPQYSGLWGGNLQVQEMQIAPAYYSVDPQEAARTAQALKVGLSGAVNFTFQNLGTNQVSLEPANVMFMVPGKDTMAADQISQMMGGMQNSPMGAMMRNMANNMSVPLIMQFGNANTVGSAGETSLSGEQFQSAVMKNDIRQLEPGVLEQQIVTRQTYYAKKTNAPRSGYGETVIRFIWRGPTQMYVQAATVEYDGSKRFLTKTVLGGYVQKGQAMNTDPMSSMQMPGMTIPGMMPNGSGMPNGLNIPNSGTIPGIDPNFMKQIFGQ